MKQEKPNKTQLHFKKFKISRITNLNTIKGGSNDCITPDEWTTSPTN